MKFKRTMISSTMAMSLVALAGCGSEEEGGEQSPSSYFEGKDMTLIMPYGPGGTMDSAARIVAEHLGDHLDASVSVRNVEGGGGIIGMNALADSDPDGLTLGYMSGGGMVGATLAEAEGKNFETLDLGYVATMTGGPRSIFAGPESGFETWQDVLDAGELRFASSGVGGSDHIDAVVLDAVFPELSIDIVTGMTDGAERTLTVTQGALDAFGGKYAGRESEIDDGNYRPVLTVGSAPLEDAPDVPVLATDFDLSEEAQAIVDARVRPFDIYRIVLTPPDVPQERLEALREAFDEVFHDEDFVADLSSVGRTVEYMSGPETREAMEESVNPPAEYAELIEDASEGQ